MNVFYNSKKKKPNEWVIIVFILVPILIAILFFVYGRKVVERNVDFELDESRIRSSESY